MKLSNNFTFLEATKSFIALRLDIENVPTEQEIEKLKLTAKYILQPPRELWKTSFAPSSWFRCRELCWALMSKKRQDKTTIEDIKSQHIEAQAVDFEIPGVDNLVLAHWMVENTEFDKIILEFYDEKDPNSGWVHASFASLVTNRHKVLTYSKGIYTHGLPN